MDVTLEVYELHAQDADTVRVGLREIVTRDDGDGGTEELVGGYLAPRTMPRSEMPALFDRYTATMEAA